jgi:hypothetical protein
VHELKVCLSYDSSVGPVVQVVKDFFTYFLAAWQGDYHWVGGRKETAIQSEPTILELESGNWYIAHPHSFFVPNFMTKFALEDFQSQGRLRPPPSETAFSRFLFDDDTVR